MIRFKLNDKSIYGNEAGEDEDAAILNSYFVDHNDFGDFFDQSEKLSIVSARKGMGKSALLARLQYKLENNKATYGTPIIIRAKGNDLLGLGDFEGKDQAYLENYWKQIICKKVIVEIGNNIGIALSSDNMSIVEIAELEGMKSKNFIGSLISRLKLKTANIETSSPENLEHLLDKYQKKNRGSTVWILIDDIDAKFTNTHEYQARVASFFSAIRALAFDLSNLKIRATVRSDVWSCLRHIEDLDKIEQYKLEIVWTKKHMLDMLAKRVLSYVKRKYPDTDEAKLLINRDYNKIIDLVFHSPVKWSGDTEARLFDAISVFSNRRPRWMGQLCRMGGVRASRSSTVRKITLTHFNDILEEFGKNRRDDLIKEHRHQFEDIANLIDSFRASASKFTYSEINTLLERVYIKQRDKSKIPELDGMPYSEPEDLGNFLYKLGLISRVHDDNKTFTHFYDDPDLYRSNENRENNIVWSIHPTYRTFLNIKKS